MHYRIGCTFSATVLVFSPAAAPVVGTAWGQAAQKPAASAASAETASASPQPVRTEILAFGAWSVTCREFAAGGPPRACQAMLEVVQQPQGGAAQPLLSWVVRPEGAGKASATLVTPTGVTIAPGIEVRLGKAAARTVAYAACDARCSANFAFDEGWAKDLAAADTGEVVLVTTNGKPARFTFPVAGFDKAWAALKK